MQAILNTRGNKENTSNFSTMVENYFLVKYFVHCNVVALRYGHAHGK